MAMRQGNSVLIGCTMKKNRSQFSTGATDCYFNASFEQLSKLTDPGSTVVVTDQQVYRHHRALFAKWNTIVLRSGEEYKVQATVDALIEQLISLKADRSTTLVGVGGGVITDLVGYTAAVYMRGIRFGFVPTTLLAMVDASIGGKNGVDVGVYKNLVGTIRQPSFCSMTLRCFRPFQKMNGKMDLPRSSSMLPYWMHRFLPHSKKESCITIKKIPRLFAR